MRNFAIFGAAVVLSLVSVDARAREVVNVVGSSTVFPFAAQVAEQFGKSPEFETPKVESTGSGGGLELFCDGVGVDYPDITNASRRIKASELSACNANGVSVIEIEVGFDGIVLANAIGGPRVDMSREHIWSALAKVGPRPMTWSEVDPSLPDAAIEVLGPPPSSGTRDAFEELVMVPGCLAAGKDEAFCEGDGAEIRSDGRYIEAGENDNVIVARLQSMPTAFGVFGYSFLDRNLEDIQGAWIDGVAPTRSHIDALRYPLTRKLYVYAKKEHFGVVPGIGEYLNEFLSDNASGPDGYLARVGLIPLTAEGLEASRANKRSLKTLTAAELD